MAVKPNDLAELVSLEAELARLEEQYPAGSPARSDGLDGYIKGRRTRAETLRKQCRPDGVEAGGENRG